VRLTAFGLSCSMLACQSGQVSRVEPTVPPSEPAPGDEQIIVEHEPEAIEPEPIARGPEAAVEITLPHPALWVEVSLGSRIVDGLYQLEGQCASIWFDDAQRVEWLQDGRTRAVNEPLSSAWGHAGAFHDSPVGNFVICDVSTRPVLRCRDNPCAYIWEDEGRNWAARRRCGLDPPPGRRSDIQRTRGFVPTRHWSNSDYFSTELSYICLRIEGHVYCYPLQWRVTRSTRIETPELSAWSDVRDVAAGGSQACAVRGDGSVYCWGMPYMPQVADDRSNEEAVLESMLEYSGHPWTPRRIEGLPPVVQISVGRTLACARTDDGRVFCWGAPACLASPSFP
jgi:hypothetical protein